MRKSGANPFTRSTSQGQKHPARVKTPFTFSWPEEAALILVGLIAIGTIVGASLLIKHKAYPVSDVRDDPLETLTGWLTLHGAKMDRVRILPSAQGRHVILRRPLASHELILEVPRPLTINAREGRRQLGAVFGPKNAHALDPEVVLTLALLRERSLGDTSFFAPYLRVLPSRIFNGATVSADDRSCLHPFAVRRAAALHERVLSIVGVAGEIAAKFPSFFANVSSVVVNVEAVTWAFTNVMTRAVHTGRDVMMVPGMDMMNHNGPRGGVFGEVKESGLVQVQALEALSAGDEVFLNYYHGGSEGPLTTLLNYGFVDEKATVVESLYEMERRGDRRLEAIGCYEETTMRYTHTGEASEGMWRCVVADAIVASELDLYLDGRMTSGEHTVAYYRTIRAAARRLADQAKATRDLFPEGGSAECKRARGEIVRVNTLMRDVYAMAIERYTKLAA